MTDLGRDLVHGLRLLRRNPGFAAVAVFTLAVGIGANAALFSLVNAVLLRPLPYADPDRLFVVYGQRDGRTLGRGGTSQPDAADWTEGLSGVARLATLSYWTVNLSGREVPERVLGVRVSGEYFDIMGGPPRLGRTLRPEDDRPEAAPVAVLSEGFWRRAFGADAGIVGRAIILEGIPHVVVGVMPARGRWLRPRIQARSRSGRDGRGCRLEPEGAAWRNGSRPPAEERLQLRRWIEPGCAGQSPTTRITKEPGTISPLG